MWNAFNMTINHCSGWFFHHVKFRPDISVLQDIVVCSNVHTFSPPSHFRVFIICTVISSDKEQIRTVELFFLNRRFLKVFLKRQKDGKGKVRHSETDVLPLCHATNSLSLASVKSRLVLPFWYRLTRVVPEKGPLTTMCFSSKHPASSRQRTGHARPGERRR